MNVDPVRPPLSRSVAETDRGAPVQPRRPRHWRGAGVDEEDTRVRLLTDVVLLVLCASLLATMAVPSLDAVRPEVALACMSLVPGWAVLTLLPRIDLTTTFALSIVVSLAVETVISVASLSLGLWRPYGLATIIGVPSVGVIILDIASEFRTKR